jgi:hypothetical protein
MRLLSGRPAPERNEQSRCLISQPSDMKWRKPSPTGSGSGDQTFCQKSSPLAGRALALDELLSLAIPTHRATLCKVNTRAQCRLFSGRSRQRERHVRYQSRLLGIRQEEDRLSRSDVRGARVRRLPARDSWAPFPEPRAGGRSSAALPWPVAGPFRNRACDAENGPGQLPDNGRPLCQRAWLHAPPCTACQE